MDILFIGAGAIGTYIGGSLSLAGHRIRFIEQPGIAERLRANGFRLQLDGITHKLDSPEVFNSVVDALRAGPADLVVIALKSFDTESVVNTLLPLKGKLPPALCLQNGVENEPMLKRVFGDGNVIAGTVTSSIGKTDTGEIILERKRGIGIALGHPLSIQAVSVFSEAQLRAKSYTNGLAMKWSKMVTNLMANATAAILGYLPLETYLNSGLYRIERQMLRECLSVMQAMHLPAIDLPGTPVRALSYAVRHLPAWISQPLLARAIGEGRGRKMPSFYLDLESGRGKSEVGFLNGAVDRFGKQFGTDTPVNRALTTIVEGLVSGKESRTTYYRNPDLLIERIAQSLPK